MSAVTINARCVHSIDQMNGSESRLSLCLELSDNQIREAVTDMLGNLTSKQVAEFLRDEYVDLIQEKTA